MRSETSTSEAVNSKAMSGNAVSDQPFVWQGIESAPKDWSEVILFDAEYDLQVTSGYYSCEDGGDDAWVTSSCNNKITPTHWMPLPAPPEL